MANLSRCKAPLVAIFVIAASLALAAQERPNWEYKVLKIDAVAQGQTGFALNPPESALNALGKEGWEMVSASIEPGTKFEKLNAPAVNGTIDPAKAQFVPYVHAQSLIMIFKRQILSRTLAPTIRRP